MENRINYTANNQERLSRTEVTPSAGICTHARFLVNSEKQSH